MTGSGRRWGLWQLAGVAILAMMPLHAYLRKEGGWALISTCDLAAFATAIGLIRCSHTMVGTAFLFELMVGTPALVMGIFTTYDWNLTGILVHVVPLTLGAIYIRHDGLPRRAVFYAWFGYALSIPLAWLVVPPIYNINFSAQVWKPLAGTFNLPLFWAALLVLNGALLGLGWFAISWLPSRVRSRPRDTGR